MAQQSSSSKLLSIQLSRRLRQIRWYHADISLALKDDELAR
jgi:hypothetical protein